MNKPFLNVKAISKTFVIAYPIAIVLYAIWIGMARSVVYWEGVHSFTSKILCLQGFGFIIFLICLLLADLRAVQGFIVSLLVVCLLCFTSVFWFALPAYEVEDVEQLNHHTYMLVSDDAGTDYGYDWTLLDCFPVRFLCKRIPLKEETVNMGLVLDSVNNELHVLYYGNLLYTAGSPNRRYVESDEKSPGPFSYFISVQERRGKVFYGLYQCNVEYTCMEMQFLLTLSREEDKLSRDFYVKTEESSGEILVYRKVAADEYADDGSYVKIFTYDGRPHCHVSGCSITGK